MPRNGEEKISDMWEQAPAGDRHISSLVFAERQRKRPDQPSPGISKPFCLSASISALHCSSAKATSGGRTVRH
jgi:hypothetical protein